MMNMRDSSSFLVSDSKTSAPASEASQPDQEGKLAVDTEDTCDSSSLNLVSAPLPPQDSECVTVSWNWRYDPVDRFMVLNS